MATQETKHLDSIIASRRSLLLGGGAAALAATVMPKSAKAANAVTSYGDSDILNFALNLEYLEANFYWLAAFGTTIDKPNAASMAVGAPPATALTGIVGQKGAAGAPGTVNYDQAVPVPFKMPGVKSYAIETAIEEVKHVNYLRSALGAAVVAQPPIDLSSTAWNTLVSAAGIGSSFNPFASDANFLVAAYVFEDVGVTAYKGAAPLISTSTQGKTYLQAAASILAVEAYHAGLIRTTINSVDPMNAAGYLTLTQQVSALRTKLSQAAVATGVTATVDDYGLIPPGTSGYAPYTYSLEGTMVPSTGIVDADPTNVIAFSRTTTQVLNIVTGGKATASGVAAGVFFPSGLNGIFA